VHPHDFLNDISGAADVTTPRRRPNRPDILTLDLEAEPAEDGALLVPRNVQARKRQRPLRRVLDRAAQDRRRSRADNRRCFPAGQLERELRGDGDPRIEKSGIDSAFEPDPRVRRQPQRLPGPAIVPGYEIGALDQITVVPSCTPDCSPPMMPPIS
jgi:hypothetical protein